MVLGIKNLTQDAIRIVDRDIPVGTVFSGTFAGTDHGLFLRTTYLILRLENYVTQGKDVLNHYVLSGNLVVDYVPHEATLEVK